MSVAVSQSETPREPGEYAIEIDFQKGTQQPAIVFKTMASLIESFQQLDRNLARSIAVNIEPVLLLQEVEAGSIRAWLSTLLRSVDDSDLAKLDWKAMVGKFLVKAKRKIIEFLEKSPQNGTAAGLRELRQEVLSFAEATEVRRLPAYTPIEAHVLANDLRRISSSVASLSDREQARLIVEQASVEIRRDFSISDQEISLLDPDKVVTVESDLTLTVKKPDYLGHSMWEFRRGDSSIAAKISDKEWLDKFHSRDLDLRPGDAIRAHVIITTEMTPTGIVVAKSHEVAKVFDILPSQNGAQLDLSVRNESDTSQGKKG